MVKFEDGAPDIVYDSCGDNTLLHAKEIGWYRLLETIDIEESAPIGIRQKSRTIP